MKDILIYFKANTKFRSQVVNPLVNINRGVALSTFKSTFDHVKRMFC